MGDALEAICFRVLDGTARAATTRTRKGRRKSDLVGNGCWWSWRPDDAEALGLHDAAYEAAGRARRVIWPRRWPSVIRCRTMPMASEASRTNCEPPDAR
jgi:hypothetical protein